jgi:N-acetyltransferase
VDNHGRALSPARLPSTPCPTIAPPHRDPDRSCSAPGATLTQPSTSRTTAGRRRRRGRPALCDDGRVWDGLSTRLQGDIVVLEPLTAAHADGLFEAASWPEIWEWWLFDPAIDRERFDGWLDGVLTAVADGREARFATRDAHSGRVLGSTSYCGLRPEHRAVEIGWTWLTPAAWRTGANADAKLLQLQHAIETLGCHRVEFQTDERNERSRRALEALPARHEGVLRDYMLLAGGRRRSSAVYSVLDSEWPAVKANLQRRVQAARQRRDERSMRTGQT